MFGDEQAFSGLKITNKQKKITFLRFQTNAVFQIFVQISGGHNFFISKSKLIIFIRVSGKHEAQCRKSYPVMKFQILTIYCKKLDFQLKFGRP